MHPAIRVGLIALALADSGAALAQGAGRPNGSITGVATDSARVPVDGADIQVDGGRWRATTDLDGRFRLEGIPDGRHVLVARRLGFAPESLSTTLAGAPVAVSIVLHAVASELERVSVVDETVIPARLQGFEHRRGRKGEGQFITRADIERRGPAVTSDLVRRLQGLRIVDSLGVSLAVSTRGPKMMSGRPVPVQCVMRVGVDGFIKEPYFPMNTIIPTDIHGIEVYSGAASLPPEFGGARKDAGCGLVMIWTRSR